MKKQGELSVADPQVIVVDDDLAVRNSLKFSLELKDLRCVSFQAGSNC
jgi:FixJ family two-component response regulator